MTRRISFLVLLCLLIPGALAAGEWTNWRGPFQNGVSPETGLPDHWSQDGENLIWRADFVGRSTPAVFDGRVCAIGRTGDGITKQGVVACWDAGNGAKRWEYKFNVYNTTVPFTRVGWASVAGDSETGYLYAHSVHGFLWCFDRDGKIVWQWNLGEDLGRASGYGGRTHSPIVDEDQVLLTVINTSWGEQAPPRHRFFAFDKRTGAVNWVATAGNGVEDFNTQATPVVAVIGGQRLLIGPTAEGWIYALKVRTGEEVWRYDLSQRGLNTSPVVAGHTVYATHSEENIDDGQIMGRVVAFDGRGTGDLTGKGEIWRATLLAGYASPLYQDGRLYVVDNSANLFALDGATGKQLWEHNFGTVGKGSPVWADGKIYVTEVNGNFHIIRPGDEGATDLDADHIEMPSGRYAEVYGSPAVAYGRIYFATENGVFAIGNKSAPFEVKASAPVDLGEEPAAADAAPAAIQLRPAEVVLHAGKSVRFEVRAFDDHGRALNTVPLPTTFQLAGLKGTLEGGTFTADPQAGDQVGKVQVKAGNLTASARVRVAAPLPWSEDFEGIEVGKAPPSWLGVGRKASVQTVEGQEGKVFVFGRPASGVPRGTFLMGIADMKDYTVQADVLGTQQGRRRSDVGVINAGYTLDLQGNHQRLEIRSWAAELRMAKQVDFAWEPNVWYTVKLRVDQEGGKAVVRGKVWKRGEAEPAAWTLTAEDPLPITEGVAGLYGFAPVDIYYDNLKVTTSPQVTTPDGR